MKAKKVLADAMLQELMEKYPGIPRHALPRPSITGNTANGITKSVIKWLQLKGHYCSRIQSQGQYNPTLGRWTKSNVKRGIGDILAVINGRTVMIEVKAGSDKQSEWQKKTEKEVEASGGVYLLVKSFDDFMKWYEQIK